MPAGSPAADCCTTCVRGQVPFCAHSHTTAAQKSRWRDLQRSVQPPSTSVHTFWREKQLCFSGLFVLCLSMSSSRAVIHDVLHGLDSSNCLVLQVGPCSALPCCATLCCGLLCGTVVGCVVLCHVLPHSGDAPHVLSNAYLHGVSSNSQSGWQSRKIMERGTRSMLSLRHMPAAAAVTMLHAWDKLLAFCFRLRPHKHGVADDHVCPAVPGSPRRWQDHHCPPGHAAP
jgi:hypothetical protein